MYRLLIIFLLIIQFKITFPQVTTRIEYPILSNWYTIANDTDINANNGFELLNYRTNNWIKTDIPHNWDTYEGFRRLKHGNRHGTAWYRNNFSAPNAGKNKQYFLYFEGVGSYATVWVNGILVGKHAGGRTTFTIDITKAIIPGESNLLAVKAEHPSKINNLPWVCGGCSDEWGFSEGSQPMGIFRPVSLIVTNKLRIEPFGIHVWNDSSANEKSASINIETEIKNYSHKSLKIEIVCSLYDRYNKKIAELRDFKQILPNEKILIGHQPMLIKNPVLWSLENPHLYTLRTEIIEKRKIIDALSTLYGIRTISWPIGKTGISNQFLLNGKPVFINGISEYEHNMGQSHAFSDQQINTRVMQVRAAGFNAFRDAHQPHNLRYQANWDSLGLLWWPQFAAHIWFDNPEFKENFKQLLSDWIKERRNSPSIILWGLENESSLPTDIAQEYSNIIRQLDPTTSSQRKITTCNGGTGTDWNVIQNWSGTYNGIPNNYAEDLKKELLNGEYGAWRNIDLHTEGPFIKNAPLSEDRFAQLMELKIRLAESVKDSICGQFHWLLNSHENPGRVQSGEGYRDIDRIGPVNYKGLFTPWGEPTDAFYMFRSNYAPKDLEPMVYIVSHTWPNRWMTPGIKDSIIVYSNCDQVELFNDISNFSLGKKTRNGTGTHFQWDKANIHFNILYAVGYNNGKITAVDMVQLNHLPEAPGITSIKSNKLQNALEKEPGYNYLYRVNCGGPDYKDSFGNKWLADKQRISDLTWGSKSWTDNFVGLPAFYGSQRRIFDPIQGTTDWELLQTFRYGREKLSFEFPVPDGDYLVELYFVEPWYGPNISANSNGWRQFDVAINNKTYLHNVDIYNEAGYLQVLKKKVFVNISGGLLKVHFPSVNSGQAVISAIAIASKYKDIKPSPSPEPNISNFKLNNPRYIDDWNLQTWLDIGNKQYLDKNIRFNYLPPALFGADWIQTTSVFPEYNDTLATFTLNRVSDVFIALDSNFNSLPQWMDGFTDTKTFIITDNENNNTLKLFTKRIKGGVNITLGKLTNNSDHKTLMYTVAVVPTSNLVEAVDQRPAIRMEAENTKLEGTGFVVGVFNEKKYISFPNLKNSSIEWTINPGVAGTYNLKFRYINSTDKTIPMGLKIIDSSGNTVLNTKLEFTAEKSDKWKSLNTNTGTSINAGNYKIILNNIDSEGLWVDALEFQ